MSTINSSVPMVECPYCEHEFQQDDYYEMGVGTEFECPECEKTIVILETDVQIVWTLGTSEEWDEDLARSKAAHEKALAYTLGVIAKSKEKSSKAKLIQCDFDDQLSEIGSCNHGFGDGESYGDGVGNGFKGYGYNTRGDGEGGGGGSVGDGCGDGTMDGGGYGEGW